MCWYSFSDRSHPPSFWTLHSFTLYRKLFKNRYCIPSCQGDEPSVPTPCSSNPSSIHHFSLQTRAIVSQASVPTSARSPSQHLPAFKQQPCPHLTGKLRWSFPRLPLCCVHVSVVALYRVTVITGFSRSPPTVSPLRVRTVSCVSSRSGTVILYR